MAHSVEDVFTSLMVRPSHGQRRCVVSWQVTPAWDDAKFFVYRSDTGAKPWINLTPDGIQGAQEFEDDELYVNSKLESRYYSVFAELGAEMYSRSADVGMFDHLKRTQYNLMRAMIKREIKDRRRGNGLKVFHYIPLTSGEPNPKYDSDSGQVISSCPDETSFGLPFVGGFGEPIQTWMKIISDDVYKEEDESDGSLVETVTETVRLLAWPQPRRGHLIVHPPTGDFYVVDSVVKPFRFRGFAPIAYHVKLLKLRRSDPRYKVPVPEFLPDSVTVA